MSKRFLLATLVVCAGACSGLAQQPAAKGGEGPAGDPPTGVLWLETNDWDKMLVSPKDAGLKRAMRMLPARLAELPGELPNGGGAGIPKGAEQLLGTLISSPMRMSLTYNAENQGGFMGAGLQLSLGAADEATAKRTAGMVKSLMSDAPLKPKDSAKYPGMSEILTPLGMIRFGPAKSGGGWAYQIQAGTVQENAWGGGGAGGDGGPDFGPDAAGIAAHTKVKFVAAPLAPFLDFAEMLAAADPQASEMIRKARESGLFAPGGLSATYIAGYTDDRSVSITTISGAASYAGLMGMSRAPLTEADFRVVPEDAQWGYVGRFDLSALKSQLGIVTSNPEAKQGLEQFKQATGVDLVTDVVEQLGGGPGGVGSYAFFLSDTTGGGGMFSTTGVISLADGKKFGASIEKIATFANGELAKPEAARGYVMARAWSDQRVPGCTFTSISFAGLPIPIEVTAAVAGDRLVLSLSPQGAMGAAKQVMSTGRGILGNPRIADALGKADTKSMIAFSFNDTSKTVREGYPLASMLGTAAGNMVRSKAGAKSPRDPGMVTPTYGELIEGARCSVSWSTWRGDDYVKRCEGDRSVFVRLAASAGKITPFLPLIEAAGAAAALDQQKKQMPVHNEDDGVDGDKN